MKRFAVLGNPITHSLSPQIHQYFAQQLHLSLVYDRILGLDREVEEQINAFFTEGGCGLNITLPYKQRAFALAKHHTPRCRIAGAANTLWVEDNVLHADNTDGIGLIRDLTHHISLSGKRVVILGTGGAARGIIHPLLAADIASLTVAGRQEKKATALTLEFPLINAAALQALQADFDLVINATSSSVTEEALVLPHEVMAAKPVCYDLAYNIKEPTRFVRDANEHGCLAVDGLGMLIEQAAEAFFIWHGIRPDTKNIATLLCKNHRVC